MKKAQLGFLQKLILILAGSFVLLLVFGMTFAKYMGEASELERCKTSAMVMDAAREKTTEKILNLDCPMRETYVDYKDVRVDGKLSDDKVFQVIAEDMKDAWYVMGEGRFLPFDQNLLFGITNPCVILSHITFDEEIYNQKAEISGFKNFLETTLMKNSEELYIDYFKINDSIRDRFLLNEGSFLVVPGSQAHSYSATDKLDLSKEYYVIYNVNLPAKADQKTIDGDRNKIVEVLVGKERLEYYAKLFPTYDSRPPTIIFYVIAADNLGGAGCGYIANTVR